MQADGHGASGAPGCKRFRRTGYRFAVKNATTCGIGPVRPAGKPERRPQPSVFTRVFAHTRPDFRGPCGSLARATVELQGCGGAPRHAKKPVVKFGWGPSDETAFARPEPRCGQCHGAGARSRPILEIRSGQFGADVG